MTRFPILIAVVVFLGSGCGLRRVSFPDKSEASGVWVCGESEQGFACLDYQRYHELLRQLGKQRGMHEL